MVPIAFNGALPIQPLLMTFSLSLFVNGKDLDVQMSNKIKGLWPRNNGRTVQLIRLRIKATIAAVDPWLGDYLNITIRPCFQMPFFQAVIRAKSESLTTSLIRRTSDWVVEA